jgi:diguanylate cyclase (GGDEF)-like protein
MAAPGLLNRLAEVLAGLPADAGPARDALAEALEALRKQETRTRKLTRIGDGYQQQLRGLNQELVEANRRLSQALQEVRTLQGFIPICARCKRVRDDEGYWDQVESYISRRSDAVFSHGVCPDCYGFLFPDYPVAAAGPAPRVRTPNRTEEEDRMERRLDALAGDGALAANPVAGELRDLLARHLRLLRQMDKIARISDSYQHRLKHANLALAEASHTDLLTGLPNRRAIVERIDAELDRSARGGLRPALLMVDVDHFKVVNDTLGHEAGDRLLQSLARSLRSALRAYDTCARWGGEEFLVLLPETSPEAALTVAGKLVQAVRQGGDPDLPEVTISVGVAVQESRETFTDLVRRADDAMYAAKRLGRNRAQAAAGTH